MNKIIYLDAAASSLKPQSVIATEMDFLQNKYANAGRGVCPRAAAVDNMVLNARNRIADFINADSNQIIFTSGATDGLNRIANLVINKIGCDRKITVGVSDLEHHSARLPWQNLAMRRMCDLVVCPLDENLNYDISRIGALDALVITAMSNVMGVAQDVERIVRAARAKNPDVITIVDAAQYVAHCPIDVRAWDCDFMCFSGHKIGADTGIGVMYIKNPDDFMPDKFGGGMVGRVAADGTFTTQPVPDRYEAGTLPLTQISGIVPAIDYLQSNRADLNLIKYLYDELLSVSRIKILSPRNAAVLTFVVDGMHALDFGALAGARGLCLRVGNMCASWAHMALGVPGSVRISVGPWNTMEQMREVVAIIKDIVK